MEMVTERVQTVAEMKELLESQASAMQRCTLEINPGNVTERVKTEKRTYQIADYEESRQLWCKIGDAIGASHMTEMVIRFAVEEPATIEVTQFVTVDGVIQIEQIVDSGEFGAFEEDDGVQDGK